MFEIVGLKQFGEKQQKIELLFVNVDQEKIRPVLNKFGIVVLSLKEYKNRKTDFGKVFFKVKFEGEEYDIISKHEKAREGFNFFSEIGFDITYINNLETPLTVEKVEIVLQKLKDEYNSQKTSGDAKIQIKSDKKFDEKEVKKIREFVDNTIQDAMNLLLKVSGKVSPALCKKLQDEINEVKKYRLGSNTERMSSILENILNIMEAVDMAYIDLLKSEEQERLHESIVSELDVISEYEKYNKAQKLLTLGKNIKVGKNVDDKFYEMFGKMGIYIKLLFKDIRNKLSNPLEILYYIYGILEIFVIFLIIEFGIYAIYSKFSGINNIGAIYFYMWNAGLLGIIMYFGKNFRKKDYTVIIGLYIGSIALFLLVRYLILMNFAF